MQDPKNSVDIQPVLSPEEINRKWRYLHYNLIEFKETAVKLIANAAKLKDIVNSILISEQSNLNDIEKNLLKEVLVHCQNISLCLDPFPEINFKQNDDVNPKNICKAFEILGRRITHNALNSIFSECGFIALSYKNLTSIFKKNSNSLHVINSFDVYVLYLFRLHLFSSEWLKIFISLNLPHTSIENLNTIFTNVSYTVDSILGFSEDKYIFKANDICHYTRIPPRVVTWPKFFAGLKILGAITVNLSCLTSDEWNNFCTELMVSNIVQLTVDGNLDEQRIHQLKEILQQNQTRMDVISPNGLTNIAARCVVPFCMSEKIQKNLDEVRTELIQGAKLTSAYINISGRSKILFFSSSDQCTESMSCYITQLQNAIDKYLRYDDDFVTSIKSLQGEMQVTFNSQKAAKEFCQICLEKHNFKLDLCNNKAIKLNSLEKVEFFIEKICGITLNEGHLKCLGFERRLLGPR